MKTMTPTKKQFLAYERVRKSGKFNMITQCVKAARESGLDVDTYFEIIKNYGKLHDKYMGEKFPAIEKKLAEVGSIFKNRTDAKFDYEALVEKEDGRLSCGLKVWSDGKKLDDEDLQIIRANLELQGFSEIDHVAKDDETEVTFYSFFEKPRETPAKSQPLTVADKNVLVDVLNALIGIESEMGSEFFDHYYSNGDGEKMMDDFQRVLYKITPASFRDVLKHNGGKL